MSSRAAPKDVPGRYIPTHSSRIPFERRLRDAAGVCLHLPLVRRTASARRAGGEGRGRASSQLGS